MRASSHLADDHLNPAGDEEGPPAPPVDGGDGDEGGGHEHGAGHDGGVERRPAFEPHALEQHRRVEEDGVDAGEDLEGRHEDGQHQLRPVPPLQDVLEGVLNGDGQLTGLHHVLELGFDMAGPSDLLQNFSSLFGEALLEEAVGGLREEEPADGHQRRRHGGEAQGEPPPPRIDPLCAVVDHVGREDPRGRRQLEHHVEPSPEMGRRHLGKIEGHRLRGRGRRH